MTIDEAMEVGETTRYREYDITRQREEDYVVEVAHDTLKDAKTWIDRLIQKGELDNVETKGVRNERRRKRTPDLLPHPKS